MNNLFSVIRQADLAKKLNISPQAVCKWARSGRIPAERVLAIEAATNGQVSRYQLRPDVFGLDPNVAHSISPEAA